MINNAGKNPTKYLRDYLGISGITLDEDIFHLDSKKDESASNATSAAQAAIETL